MVTYVGKEIAKKYNYKYVEKWFFEDQFNFNINNYSEFRLENLIKILNDNNTEYYKPHVSKYIHKIKNFMFIIHKENENKLYAKFRKITIEIEKSNDKYYLNVHYPIFNSLTIMETDYLKSIFHSFSNVLINLYGYRQNYLQFVNDHLFYDLPLREHIYLISFDNNLNVIQINHHGIDYLYKKYLSYNKMRETFNKNLNEKIQKNEIFKKMIIKYFCEQLRYNTNDIVFYNSHDILRLTLNDYINDHIKIVESAKTKIRQIRLDNNHFYIDDVKILEYGYDQLGQLVLKIMIDTIRPLYYLLGFNPLSHPWSIRLPPVSFRWKIRTCLNWAKGVNKKEMKNMKIFEY